MLQFPSPQNDRVEQIDALTRIINRIFTVRVTATMLLIEIVLGYLSDVDILPKLPGLWTALLWVGVIQVLAASWRLYRQWVDGHYEDDDE